MPRGVSLAGSREERRRRVTLGVVATVGIIGGGIFGITAALSLRRRGFEVTVYDPGPIPHPLAESTDISKIVRLDYGDDELYTAMMERALEEWRRWSASAFFHETGVLFLRRSPLAPGSFEGESYALLSRRGHDVQRLDAKAIRRRFPAWNGSRFTDGYFNPEGGWAESGNVVLHLAREASALGVRLAQGTSVARLAEAGSRVTGVVTTKGDVLASDFVVVAAGSWTSEIVPAMTTHLRSTGQPVFHLAPSDASPYASPAFPVFTADIARTGYYGFPASKGGLVKIANHGLGREMHPDSAEREVTSGETSALRSFLRDAIPELASSRIASTRLCVYCDTWDQHFWIAPDPDRPGLVVATGGSGHAFKFAPIVGDLIADALEGGVAPRFRWRPEIPHGKGHEQARHQG